MRVKHFKEFCEDKGIKLNKNQINALKPIFELNCIDRPFMIITLLKEFIEGIGCEL